MAATTRRKPTMNVSSTVTAALAAPLTPSVAASALAAGQLLAEGAAALLGSRGPDLLATLAGAAGPSRVVAGSTSATAKATTTPKTTAAKATTTTTKATTSASTTKTSTPAPGYGTAASGDYAFLKDPKLSVEEKLFRFICAVAQKADEDLLKKMEEMKGGSAAKAGASGAATSAGGTAAKGKTAPFSLWGAMKALLPPLGLAAKVMGDSAVKALLTKISGPVCAAACTALGMPMLAPLALKVGPQLATSVAGALEDAVKGAASAAGGSPSAGSGGTGTAGGAASASGSAKNEQVQMMELQRLVDKQKEMFSLVSNILRATHDTRMAVIGNVR
jgi:hypothetical protein